MTIQKNPDAVDVEWNGATIPVLKRGCPICGLHNDESTRLSYAPAPWTLKTCVVCDMTYLEEAPLSEALETTIAWEVSFEREAERRREQTPYAYRFDRITRWRMRLLPRHNVAEMVGHLADPGPVIDIGCGGGGLGGAYLSHHVPYGVEISPALAAEAREKFRLQGGDVVQAPAVEGLKAFPDGFFVGATLRSYLEHEAEPVAVLDELHRILAPTASAVIKVPNFASLNRRIRGAHWCGFRYPDHLNHFTPRTLERLARRCGFSCHAGWTDRLPTSDNMYATLRPLARQPSGKGQAR